MSRRVPAQLQPETWLRLKEHVADLAELEGDARDAALSQLSLGSTDRRWLAELLAPLDARDGRLREPLKLLPQFDADLPLRWRDGDCIGAYRIESLLGRGGMGEVYRAQPLAGGTPVALKVLRAGLEQSYYAHFSTNEQRALRRLDDPRIAHFVEAFSLPDVGVCLVLELVAGEPLQTYCRSRRFGVDARLKLFIEVCHAVAGAHRQLVVHRDLKPSNVLVTPEGQVKLLDFGVAKLLDADDTQTQTHGGLCTLEYAAPEQVLREPVSAAIDIYALGVLLYQLLTDVTPYPRADQGLLVKAVLNDPPQPFAAALARARAQGRAPPAATLDRDLERIVVHAMEKEPASRYLSTTDLASDVQAVLDGRPIRGGGGTLYRCSKFLRRHRAVALGAGVAVVSLLAATGISFYAADRTARQAHRADVANRFLLTVLDLNDVYSGRRRGEASLDNVLADAVARARVDLRDEPQVRADVLGQLGEALEHRGRLAAALDAETEANAIRAADPERDSYEYAAGLNALASVEMGLSRFDAAESHLQEALRESLAHPVEDQRALLGTYAGLSRWASLHGDARTSLGWDERLIQARRASEGDDSIDLAMDYNRRGGSLVLLHRYAEASESFRLGRSIVGQRLGTSHMRYGALSYGLAASLVQQGQFAEARAALADARSALVDRDDPRVVSPFGAAAERLQAQLDFIGGDYPAARARMQTVIAATPHISPVTLGTSLILMGRIELAQGNPAAAGARYAEAERQFVDNGRPRHPQRWLALGLGGAARAALGDRDGGEAQTEQALAQLDGDDDDAGAEQIELALASGAAARRRGDLTLAYARHAQAQAIQRRSGWLGELGAASVDAELAQDTLAGSSDFALRGLSLEQLAGSMATLARINPADARLPALSALRDTVGIGYTLSHGAARPSAPQR
jgi:serine/threonine-protein kinase